MLTNDVVSFEQPGPAFVLLYGEVTSLSKIGSTLTGKNLHLEELGLSCDSSKMTIRVASVDCERNSKRWVRIVLIRTLVMACTVYLELRNLPCRHTVL